MRRRHYTILKFVLFVLFIPSMIVAQSAERPVMSLLGKPLPAPELSPETRADFEKKLATAQAEFKKNPKDADAIIWLGRRTAYLGRYFEAIDIFTRGAQIHPNDARMYRHRGHRYITTRQIERAIADLQKAAKLIEAKEDQIEPDGLPNAKNIPRSTTNSNVWYHLGLAYYLRGDFAHAGKAYRECLKFSDNDDMWTATAHWLYMTLRRLNQADEARQLLNRVRPKMDIIENSDYHLLLLMYKGEKTPEQLLEASKKEDLSQATVSYGVANWYLYSGQSEKAYKLMNETVAGKEWAAFGYIAAEAELSKISRGDAKDPQSK